MPLGISLSDGAEASESMTKYSKASDRHNIAFGISFVSNEYVVFQPCWLLYLFWKAIFLILIVFPFCWISFSKMEASMAPAWNLFSGFGMQITSAGTRNMFKYLFFFILNTITISVNYKIFFEPQNYIAKIAIIIMKPVTIRFVFEERRP